VKLLTLYSFDGRKLNEIRDSKVDLTSYPAGTYVLDIILEGGTQFKHKVIRK